MNWISQFLEIFNLTSSRWQLFENIGDLKKILKIPLFFNLLINDLIFIIQQCTLSNYAKDNNLSLFWTRQRTHKIYAFVRFYDRGELDF